MKWICLCSGMMDDGAEKLAGLRVRENAFIHGRDDVRGGAELDEGRVRRFRIPARHEIADIESPVLDKIAGPYRNGAAVVNFASNRLRSDDRRSERSGVAMAG